MESLESKLVLGGLTNDFDLTNEVVFLSKRRKACTFLAAGQSLYCLAPNLKKMNLLSFSSLRLLLILYGQFCTDRKIFFEKSNGFLFFRIDCKIVYFAKGHAF